MTSDPPNDPSGAPADGPTDEMPIVKIGLDPGSRHTLTDVTDEIGAIRFRAHSDFRFRARRRRRDASSPDADPPDGNILEGGVLELEEVRPGALRLALRNAAVEGAQVQVEFYPDGDRPGALRISASCLVTSVSIRAYGPHSRWRRDDDDEPEVWREDEFELTFTSNATHGRIEQRS